MMTVFLAVLLGVVCCLIFVAIIGGSIFAVISLSQRVYSDVYVSGDKIIFRKNIKTRNTFLLGMRGSVRTFNYLFQKKNVKDLLCNEGNQK